MEPKKKVSPGGFRHPGERESGSPPIHFPIQPIALAAGRESNRLTGSERRATHGITTHTGPFACERTRAPA